MPLVGHRDIDALAAWAERKADDARSLLGIEDDAELVDVVDALRRLRAAGVIFGSRIVADDHLPLAEAQWDPRGKTITIRKSVLEAAKAGDGRARFTICHEVAHAFLQHKHRRNRVTMGQKEFGALLQTQEAEANRFAAAFLCPRRLATITDKTSARSLARRFGMSLTAAEYRLLELRDNRISALSSSLSIAERPAKDDEEADGYEVYLQAVLRQAVMYPDR